MLENAFSNPIRSPSKSGKVERENQIPTPVPTHSGINPLHPGLSGCRRRGFWHLAQSLHSRCLATFPAPPAEELSKESQLTPGTQEGDVLGCQKDLKLRSWSGKSWLRRKRMKEKGYGKCKRRDAI